jgi:hypothetical protein
MERQQIGLKLTMNALGLPARLESFPDRLILQKAVYLSQAAGVLLGYHYNWYLRGPYSPSLTRDAFAVAAELAQGSDEGQGWRLDETSLQRLEDLKPLLNDQEPDQRARHLELLASVHFLLQTGQGRSTSPEELGDVLRRYGKDFTAQQIRQAIEELTQYGLCPRCSTK